MANILCSIKQFTITDSWGDGISSPGGFSVKYNGVEVLSGGAFGSSATSDPFGACLTDAPTPLATAQPTSTPTHAPTNQPTRAPKPCTRTSVTLAILTDAYPDETAWTLKNLCDGTMLFSHPYMAANTLHEHEFCLPAAQYEFTITDSWSDGNCCSHGQGYYNLSYDNGAHLVSGGDYSFSETSFFGSCPTGPMT